MVQVFLNMGRGGYPLGCRLRAWARFKGELDRVPIRSLRAIASGTVDLHLHLVGVVRTNPDGIFHVIAPGQFRIVSFIENVKLRIPAGLRVRNPGCLLWWDCLWWVTPCIPPVYLPWRPERETGPFAPLALYFPMWALVLSLLLFAWISKGLRERRHNVFYAVVFSLGLVSCTTFCGGIALRGSFAEPVPTTGTSGLRPHAGGDIRGRPDGTLSPSGRGPGPHRKNEPGFSHPVELIFALLRNCPPPRQPGSSGP